MRASITYSTPVRGLVQVTSGTRREPSVPMRAGSQYLASAYTSSIPQSFKNRHNASTAVGAGGAVNMMLPYPIFWLAGALEAAHREPTAKLKAFKIAKQSVAVLMGGGAAGLSMSLI